MNIRNIIRSTCYLEFVNNIDTLAYELLYSKKEGFMALQSKEAIKEASKVLSRFDFEASKIKQEVDFSDSDAIIKRKKEELMAAIEKHCEEQVLIWAQEIFDNLVSNALLSVSIDKTKSDTIYNRVLCAISWLAEIKSIGEEEKTLMIRKFDNDFNFSLNSTDDDYMPQEAPTKSDETLFLQLYFSIIESEDAFNSINLADYSKALNSEDLQFFTDVKNNLKTCKNSSIKDEIALVKGAVELLAINNPQDKYNFIKQIRNDFKFFYETNKKIEEKDKIDLVKKRIKANSTDAKSQIDYYKKLITSCRNE